MKNFTLPTTTVFSRKSFFLLLLAVEFLVLLLGSSVSYGQTTYVWDGSTTASTSGSNANITSAAFSSTQGNNNGTTTLISSTSGSSGYTGATGTSNFGASCLLGALSTSTSTYFSLVVIPVTNYKIQLNSISLGSRGTGTGPTTLTVYSSIDNYATAIGTANVLANSTWALSSITFSGSNLIGAISTAVTLRIYGSGGTGTASANTANWRIDDVTLISTASAAVNTAPTKLAFSTISSTTASPIYAGTAFSTTLNAQDGSSVNQNVTSLTGGTLSTSAGTISPSSYSIANGANTQTQNVTLNTAGTGISIAAAIPTSGMTSLTAATSNTFTVYSAIPSVASSVTTSAITTTGTTVGWTSGNGTGRIVIARLSTTTAVTPTLGTVYTPSTSGAFNGSTTTGTGNIVIYNGTGTSISVTNLASATAYIYDVYEYNGSSTIITYAAKASSLSTYTLATAPNANPATFTATATSTTAVGLTFTAASTIANASGYLIFQRANASATTFVPANGTAYTVGTAYGDGILAANVTNTTSTTQAISSLTANTQYTYTIVPYSYDGTNAGTLNYYITTNKTASATTLATAPSLAAVTNQTVDNNFNITFTDNATWRAAVTDITVGGASIGTNYTFGSGTLALTTSAIAGLQTAGSKTIVVIATGYVNASVTQTNIAGVATKLAITTQPTAPASNGAILAIQPVVKIQDQYSNITTSIASITAAVSAGAWTIGGTVSVAATAGTTTFSGLTATSATAVTGATIAFTSGSLTGVISSTFNIPTPPTAPLAPTITGITSGSGTLSVAFTAGGNGGSTITSYKYSTDGGATFVTRATGTTASPIIISTLSSDGTTTLTNGTTYQVQIKAVNIVGDGAASAFANGTAAAAPSAPIIGSSTATGTSGTATISFIAPVSNGGSVITTYTATSFPGGLTGTLSQAGSGTITISGLTDGTAYNFTITATNSTGTSVASAASNFVTPFNSSTPKISQTTAGNYSFVVPAGVTSIIVESYGGGGGGGGTNNSYSCAGGGAGGSYVKSTISVIPGTTYFYTVGAGGVAGASGGAGGQGNSSYFGNTVLGNTSGSLVLAVGGLGGSGNTNAGTSANYLGNILGGLGTTTNNLPNLGTAGANGGNSIGGASASKGSGTGGQSTISGSLIPGSAGASQTSTGSGFSGSAPGGGGSGAVDGSASTNQIGGIGGSGGVAISYIPTAQISILISTSGNNTWVCPDGVTNVTIEAWGAGGGGGGNLLSNRYSGSGGGGGAYVSYTGSVSAGTNYNYTVGAFGSGGASGATNSGTAGGNTYFGNASAGNSSGALFIANGGAAGITNNAANALGGIGGGSITGAGIVSWAGGSGGSASNSSTVDRPGGSGGGSGGSTSSGGSGGSGTTSAVSGGIAGATGGGVGGTSGYSTSIPTGVGTPGGGGGGAANAKNQAGGAGANGALLITYSPAAPIITSISTNPSPARIANSFTLTVNGANFINGNSVITFGGSALVTTFVSNTQLTAFVTADNSNIQTAGSVTVTVVTTPSIGSILIASSSVTIVTLSDPILDVSVTGSNSLSHGSVCPTISAAKQTYTITNTGTVASNIVVSSSDAQFVVSNLSSTSISTNATATYDVTFTPSSGGSKNTTITVYYDNATLAATSSLTGIGITPVPAVVNNIIGATVITAKGAILNGNVTTLAVCPVLQEKGFVYALATNPTLFVGDSGVNKVVVSSGTIATGTYSAVLNSLASSSEYSYKAYVYDGITYVYSAIGTFATTNALTISGIASNGTSCPNFAATPQRYTITNNGAIDVFGIAIASNNSQFVLSNLSTNSIVAGATAYYDVTFTPSSASITPNDKTAIITVSSTTSGIVSITNNVTGTGNTIIPQTVSSSAATLIANTTASLNGNVDTLGICPATIEKGFVYAITTNNSNPTVNGTSVTTVPVSGVTTGAYTLALNSLLTNTGYSYKAYVYDGISYVYGNVTTFTTLAPATKLAFVNLPTTSYRGFNLISFTVEARRDNNTVDTEYTGDVTIAKVSGLGALSGTLTLAAVAGVATFSSAQFDAVGTYTISASSGVLIATGTSGNIVVSLKNSTYNAWTNTSTSTAWCTDAYWSFPVSSPVAPTASDVAQFNNSGSAITSGITFSNCIPSILGIEVSSARTRALSIGSSSSLAGTLSLNGGIINGVENTILRNASGSLLSIVPNVSNSGIMTLSLGNTINNIVNIDGAGGISISTLITGANPLTKAGSGSGILTLSGANTYSGGTTISSGTLQLGGAGVLLDTGTVTLGGGILSTGFSTGFSETVGVLNLAASSTIALGTGSHTLTFSNSSAISWAGSILTITGWTGTAGTSGTAGKIIVGTGGLSQYQLDKIQFLGYPIGAKLVNGEVVPKVTPTLSINNNPSAYSGSAISATVVGSVIGSVINVKYNGSLTVPIAVGTYAVIADFTPTDTTNYTSLTAASAGNFIIAKATSSLSITDVTNNYSYTYNGTAQGPATATVTGSQGTVSYSYVGVSGTTYGPIATKPTNAGNYTVTATVAADSNYLAASSSATAFTIAKPTLIITAANQSVCYGTAINSITSAGTYTVSGFVNNENSSIISGAATYTTTYTGNTAYGTTGITITPVVTSLTATNYQFSAANGSITVFPNQWTGATDTDWATASNWNCGVPASGGAIEIPGSLTNYPVLNGSQTIGAITLANGASLNLNNFTLSISGTISGTGTLIGGGTSSLVINGSANQGTVYMSQTTPGTTNTVTDFTLNSTSTGSATLGNALGVSGTLTLTNGTLNTGGNLTLMSNGSHTAVVAPITNCSVVAINGEVTVERFIPARRAFRFVSSPVTTTTSIHANWQENGSNTASFGTQITGVGGATNGFDATATNSASMFTFNNTTGVWAAVTSTNGTLAAGVPYRLMVRGDRTINLSSNTPTPTNTTLRSKGVLNICDTSAGTINPNDGGLSFIGNPYQAVVDLKQVLQQDSHFNPNYYYIWDPTINTRGCYVIYDLEHGNNPVNGSHINQYLQPWQSCFVKNVTAGGSILFHESNKVTSVVSENGYKSNSNIPSYIRATLYESNTLATSGVAADGLIVNFGSNYDNSVDGNDAPKLTNQDEVFATKNAANLLGIESRLAPIATDVIPLNITQYRFTNYTMVLQGNNMSGLPAYLHDQLLQTYTEIPQTTSVNYSYVINTSDAATTASDRFRIVFQNPNLSLDANANLVFSMYPNPSKQGVFDVVMNDATADTVLILYNTLGQEVYTTKLTQSNSNHINPNKDLATGIYYVKIKKDALTTIKKLIIE